jgi:hypothetical protein
LKHLAPRLPGDFIVIDGNTLIDAPLDEIIDTHVVCQSSITTLIKEFDMSVGGKGAKQVDIENQDIFGVSNWTTDGYRDSQILPKNACRIVLKTQKIESQNGVINLKASLMKK